ncbi:MAG: LolA family protein [Candidatus Cyclobacteriaceae bacterium M3_2C_046]
MKKIFILMILVSQGLGSFGQSDTKDPKAREILDEMSGNYSDLQAYKAEFVQSLENEMENINEEFAGEITVMGDKFKLKMSGQEVYNNGSTVWTYLPDINEVNIDNYYPENGDMTPTKIITAYQDGYKYKYMEEVNESGNTYQIIDLEPEANNFQFYKIRLKINKENKHLKEWQVFDRTGSKYLYLIKEFDPDIEVSDSYFEFDPKAHRGVEIIDLR